ncbi:MAG: TonB-dependent receptor [Flavobacteriales bacterium]|nr:TonB-dependent receptor [Flavobacteriales bacterium]
MKRIFTTAILSFLVLFAFAQDTGTVKGTVKDKDSGETIIGASVVWEADKGRGAATDFDGNFSLTLPEGAQKVIITSIGYDSQTIAVTVKKGETSTVNVSMGVGSIQKEMVIVSAGKFEQKREDLTVSVSVIEPELLESRGSTSAEDALEQTPGLTIVDSEPQMRGGSGYSFGAGARVMMLVDDLPIMTGDAGRASFGFVPIENLEQIEVIKGASSVLYGSSALNGIINIRTAYPKDKPKTKINIYTGLYSAPQQESAIWWDKNDVPIYSGMNFFHSRKIKKTWDLVIGGNFLIDNGFIGPEPSDTLINSVGYVTNVNKDTDGNIVDTTYTQPRKGFENRFRMNFNLRKRSEKIPGLAFGINGNAMYSKSAGSLLWLNKDDGLFRPFGGSITLTKQTSYNIDPFITYSGPAGSKHTLRGRVFHQNNDNNNNQGNLNYVGFLEYQFAHKFANINDFTITIGAMGQYVYSKAQLYAGNGKGNGINNAINAAAYVQLDKKFWKRVNVNGGARFEYFAVNGNDTIIRPVFRIGANTKLWKEGYLRASFGEGFRFPTIAERYIFTVVGGLPIVPNTNIKPERSYAAEVALMQGIKIGKFMGYLDIAGFYQYYKNFVEFNGGNFGPVTGPFGRYAFRSLNTGDARVYGADVSLMGKGEFNSWFGMNVLLGYTYARPETMDPNYVYGTDSTGQQLTQLNTSSTIPNATVFDTPEQTAAREKAIADFIKYPVLKYRFEHLVNADVEFLFTIKKNQKLSVGLTYRYYSYMKSVDKVFYTLDALVGWGAVDFRNSHNKGDHVFDLRAAYDFSENIKLGVSVKNLTNRLYALRPLKVNPPRTIQLQLTVTF